MRDKRERGKKFEMRERNRKRGKKLEMSEKRNRREI